MLPMVSHFKQSEERILVAVYVSLIGSDYDTHFSDSSCFAILLHEANNDFDRESPC